VIILHDVIIPKVGMGITEVEISKWEVKVGNVINKGDPLIEINTEKASTVLDSDFSGEVAEILFKPGDMVEVGSVICRIK
jgi:pyruvate/2-oxoglutarate dehydrogenase complex dihydrolipoamide acyltransferase (E2) component